MLLKNLIKNIPKNKENVVITGISTNSKEIKKNYIFFAIKGNKLNGESFIKDAIYRGASVVICSSNCKFKDKNILVIKKRDIRYFFKRDSFKILQIKTKKYHSCYWYKWKNISC